MTRRMSKRQPIIFYYFSIQYRNRKQLQVCLGAEVGEGFCRISDAEGGHPGARKRKGWYEEIDRMSSIYIQDVYTTGWAKFKNFKLCDKYSRKFPRGLWCGLKRNISTPSFCVEEILICRLRGPGAIILLLVESKRTMLRWTL